MAGSRGYRLSVWALGLLLTVVWGGMTPARAQMTPYTSVIAGTKVGGSANVHVLGHLPLDSVEKTSDVTIEQEL